jgi:hypothetical protein
VLFLIPLPWWGPVIAPVIIAALMVIGGTLVTQFGESRYWPRRWSLALNAAGILLAMLVFMEDSIRVLSGGEAAVRAMLPARFNWPWFAMALLLMSFTIFDLLWQMGRGTRRLSAAAD